MTSPFLLGLRLARTRHANALRVLGIHLPRAVGCHGNDRRFAGGLVVEDRGRNRSAVDVQRAAPGHGEYQYPFHRLVLSSVGKEERAA